MKKKKIGLTNSERSEIKAAFAVYEGAKILCQEIMEVLTPENPAAIKLMQMIRPWGELYLFRFDLLLQKFFQVMGAENSVQSAATSGSPLGAIADVTEKSLYEVTDEEIHAKNQSLSEKDREFVLAMTFVMLGNQKSIQMFGTSMGKLVDFARSNDKALFRAVQVDAAVTQAPGVVERIRTAEALNDKVFLNELAKSISKSKARRHVELDDLRYMLVVVDERFRLDNLTDDDLVLIFNDDLQLLPNEKGDTLAAIKWHIKKLWECQKGNF